MSQIRFKLLSLKCSIDNIDELKSVLSNNFYEKLLGSGFVDVYIEDNELKGSFAETKTITRVVTDPFGISQEFDFIDYSYVNFSIQKVFPGRYVLTILSPPQSVKSLIDKFSAIIPGGIVVLSKDLNLNKLYVLLLDAEGLSNLRVDRLRVGNFSISDTAKASMEIVSRKSAFDEIESVVRNRAFTVDKIKGRGLYRESSFTFELVKTGLGSVTEEVLPLIKTLLIKNLDYIQVG
jgi:hypothetical protein